MIDADYIIVDGAVDHELSRKLQLGELKGKCLIMSNDARELFYAPFVFSIEDLENEGLDWVDALNCFIGLKKREGVKEESLMDVFKSFFIVEFERARYYCRFYDPNVFLKLFEALDNEQVQLFFDYIESVFLMGADETTKRISFKAGKLFIESFGAENALVQKLDTVKDEGPDLATERNNQRSESFAQPKSSKDGMYNPWID